MCKGFCFGTSYTGYIQWKNSESDGSAGKLIVGNVNITNNCKVKGYLGFFSKDWTGENPSQQDYVWLGADSGTGKANILLLRSRADGTGIIENTRFVAGHFYKGEYNPSDSSTRYGYYYYNRSVHC